MTYRLIISEILYVNTPLTEKHIGTYLFYLKILNQTGNGYQPTKRLKEYKVQRLQSTKLVQKTIHK